MTKYYLDTYAHPVKLSKEPILRIVNDKFYNFDSIKEILLSKFETKNLLDIGDIELHSDIAQYNNFEIRFYIEYKFNNQTDEILYWLEN
jgi:hypothetical protein